MEGQPAVNDRLRPATPQAKWWIVGSVAVLLGAWELAFHLWFMELPMVTGHRLNALIAALLVAGVLLPAFALLQRYERRLAAAAAELKAKNEALRALEASRDCLLVELARDLAFELVDISGSCEIALGLPDTAVARRMLVELKQEAGDLHGIVRRLLALREEGTALTDPVPSILEEYRRYRRARPETIPEPVA